MNKALQQKWIQLTAEESYITDRINNMRDDLRYLKKRQRLIENKIAFIREEIKREEAKQL